MNELVKVTEQNGEQLVSARELHEFLEVSTKFNDWFKRMCDYGFEENQDFQAIAQKKVTAQGNESEYKDYILKIDMAKELSMLARNEKGKEIRKYFIELEKAWNSPEKIMARALQIAQKELETYKQQIEYQKPLVEFADKVLGSKDSILVRTFAKLLYDEGLKIGEKKLYKWLRDNKYLNSNNEPYQAYMDYFEAKESAYNTPFGTKVSTTTLIKPKGQIYFFNKLKKELN